MATVVFRCGDVDVSCVIERGDNLITMTGGPSGKSFERARFKRMSLRATVVCVVMVIQLLGRC